jgi:hypothetical protein
MVVSDSFAEFLREQFAPLGRITMRRMRKTPRPDQGCPRWEDVTPSGSQASAAGYFRCWNRKSQWVAPCMMVCVRVNDTSGLKVSSTAKSRLQ